MVDLVFRIDGSDAKEWPITAGLCIGRATDNHLVLRDSLASGHHAIVKVDESRGLVLEDLGSSNGTHIGGGPSLAEGDTHPITPGLVVVVGETRLIAGLSRPKVVGSEQRDKTMIARIEPELGEDAPSDAEGNLGDLAVVAAFKAARPRLILCNETMRSVREVSQVECIVGRAEDEATLVVDHPAVSSRHARISFRDRKFWVEDLGSSNGTTLDGVAVEVGESRRLIGENAVMFGSVEALFVIDYGEDGRKLTDADRFRAALDYLRHKGTITRLQRERAEQEADQQDRHPGEVLLNLGFIKLRDWTSALERGRLAEVATAAGVGSKRNNGLMWVIIALLVVLIIAVFLQDAILDFTGLGG